MTDTPIDPAATPEDDDLPEIAARAQEECFYHLEAPVLRVGGFDTPYPYVQDKIYLPGPNRIVNACVRALNY